MSNETKTNTAANTDRELWREMPDDYFAPSIHVTAENAIGINVGGYVIVLPVREWHERAKTNSLKPIKPTAADEWREIIHQIGNAVWFPAGRDIAELPGFIKQIWDALPPMFYADRPLPERVRLLVKHWQRTVRVNQELDPAWKDEPGLAVDE